VTEDLEADPIVTIEAIFGGDPDEPLPVLQDVSNGTV
jgi:hypothetical protein